MAPASTPSTASRAISAGSVFSMPSAQAVMSVSTLAMASPVTCVPWPASSSRMPLVSAQAAAFDAA
jgi:hypothetical protein